LNVNKLGTVIIYYWYSRRENFCPRILGPVIFNNKFVYKVIDENLTQDMVFINKFLASLEFIYEQIY